MKKKYKIKKDVYLYIAVIIVIIIGINKGLNTYKEYKYHQTTEYKLLEVGYSKQDLKILRKYYNEKELKQLIGKKEDKTLVRFMKNKNYLHKNLKEYYEYYDLNPSKSLDEIINKVNLHQNYAYYEKTYDTDLSKNNLIMVNKYYHLNEDYEPDDLEVISTRYSWGTSGSQKIRKEAYEAFKNMHQAANENGIYLMVNSSYRDYKSQERVYNNYKNNQGEAYADKIAARPGFSEHQTGLALDIFSINNSSQATFKDSDAAKWLADNSYLYGFILRYPEGKEDITGYGYESWHFRYVGLKEAKEIHDKNITFDEYYIYNVENKK